MNILGCWFFLKLIIIYILQGNDIVAIPGTKKIKYLEENIDAAKVQLSSEELSKIRQIVNSINVIGDRYTASGMKVRNHNILIFFYLFLFIY